MDADQLIDKFVERVNSSPREPLPLEDVPAELRISPVNDGYRTDWRILRTEGIDWIKPYENQLPAPMPPTFRSLVTRHIYPELEIGDLWLFANTGLDMMHDWCTAVDVNNKQDYLTQMLSANGYIQFGRPYEAAKWDPICFDTNNRLSNGDYPLVQIDHESDKIRVTRKLTPSFTEIIEDYINGGAGLKL